jgi:large subunit ribosomal protein L35
MPKIKTRKAAAKRFRFTGSGKVIRRGAKMRHLLECKSSRKKKRLKADREVKKSDLKRIKVMLPYG